MDERWPGARPWLGGLLPLLQGSTAALLLRRLAAQLNGGGILLKHQF